VRGDADWPHPSPPAPLPGGRGENGIDAERRYGRSHAERGNEEENSLDSASNAPLVEARGLARRHPNGVDWLLHEISLSVRPGERLAVSGPSGAGKTLLLRALALLDQCETGQVLWRGDPVRSRAVPEFRSRTIYLHQRPALFEGSVEDNLRQPFLLSVHAARRFDRDWIAERLGSVGRGTDLLDRASRDLSGGESQLVALLRALQLRPLVLLLDEPTAAVCHRTRRHCRSRGRSVCSHCRWPGLSGYSHC